MMEIGSLKGLHLLLLLGEVGKIGKLWDEVGFYIFVRVFFTHFI